MQGLSMGKGGLFQKSFIRVRARKNRMLPPLEAGPSSVLDCRRREKSRFYPRKFLWMPGGHRQAWLIVESGLLYLLDRNEGRENPFKRAWKGAERERRRVACHADEQACSRYVWRRMLPPGGTSASRPPWPCFSNGTYFP